MGHIGLPSLPEFLVPLNEKPLRDVLEGISLAVGDLDKRIEDGLGRDKEGDAELLAEVKSLMDSVEDRFSKSIAESVLQAVDGLRSELMGAIRDGLTAQNERLESCEEAIALLQARDDRLGRRIDHHDAALQQVNDLAASAHEWIRDTQIDLDLKNAKLIQEASAAANAAAEAAAAVAGGAPQTSGKALLTRSVPDDKSAGSRSASREAQMMTLLSSARQAHLRPKRSNRDKGVNLVLTQHMDRTPSRSSNRPPEAREQGYGSDAEASTPAASSPSPEEGGSCGGDGDGEGGSGGGFLSPTQDLGHLSDFWGQLSEMREQIEENASMIRLLRLLPPRVDDMEDAINALQVRSVSSPRGNDSSQGGSNSRLRDVHKLEDGHGDLTALSRRIAEAEDGLRAAERQRAELATTLSHVLQQELPSKVSKPELDKVLEALAEALRGEFAQATGEFQAAMRFLRQDFHQAISQVPRLDTALIEANQARLRSQVSAMELDLEDVRKGMRHNHVVQAAGTANCVSCYNNRSQSPDPRSVPGADGKLYSRLDSGFLGYATGCGGSSPPPMSAREARSDAGSPTIGFPHAPLSSSAMAPSIPILAKTHVQQEAGLSAFDLQSQRGRKVVSRSAGGSWRGSRPSTAGRPYREAVLARSDALKEEYGHIAQPHSAQNSSNPGRSNSKGS